ncbi:hypothetical protein E2562_025341 [Oryza meyeriana var. granulata]|uniref:DUF834 domain-containing protein n=1 Tax=Oryza meyeriana var. granulata TaxID=110450 RepID=A0A6G1DNB0_9ORYZ|nr:hypothetical protein E2562_025341 [Oryza meyeriana var. granulata]
MEIRLLCSTQCDTGARVLGSGGIQRRGDWATAEVAKADGGRRRESGHRVWGRRWHRRRTEGRTETPAEVGERDVGAHHGGGEGRRRLQPNDGAVSWQRHGRAMPGGVSTAHWATAWLEQWRTGAG